MATALDLLMSAKEDVNLLSEESDICTIDAKTRVIFVPSTIVVGGVQSDKNAERIKFSCPKIVGDNLDLSKFSVRINFENVSSVDFNVSIKDQYICDDVAVDGENVTFSWLIGRNAARYMGTVRFIVCAVKTDSDSNISVEWNTTIAEVPVLEGIEIDQPQIGQEEKDVINQLLELTKNTSAEAVQNVNSAKEQAIKDIQSVSQPDTTLTIEGGLAEAKATGEAIGSLKEDLDNKTLNYTKEYYNTIDSMWVGQKQFDVSSNSILDNVSARYTKLDVHQGDIIYLYGKYNMYLDMWACVGNGEIKSYFRPSYNTNDNVSIKINIEDGVDTLYINLPFDNTNGHIIAWYKNMILHVGNYDYDEYNSLTKAIADGVKRKNTIIYVDDGTYDLIEEIKNYYGSNFFDEFNDTSMRGISLRNGIRLIFNPNSAVYCLYDGTNENVQTLFSAFYPNDYGCYIENMNLYTKNIRYSIHDERDGSSIKNHNIYKNCHIEHDSSETSWGPHQCIGGGFGKSSNIEIINCYFKSVGCDWAVSYHNDNVLGHTGYKSKVNMHNCYFEEGGCYFGCYGYGEDISEIYVSNCSFDNKLPYKVPAHDGHKDNIKLYSWNNEIRNQQNS